MTAPSTPIETAMLQEIATLLGLAEAALVNDDHETLGDALVQLAAVGRRLDESRERTWARFNDALIKELS